MDEREMDRGGWHLVGFDGLRCRIMLARGRHNCLASLSLQGLGHNHTKNNKTHRRVRWKKISSLAEYNQRREQEHNKSKVTAKSGLVQSNVRDPSQSTATQTHALAHTHSRSIASWGDNILGITFGVILASSESHSEKCWSEGHSLIQLC